MTLSTTLTFKTQQQTQDHDIIDKLDFLKIKNLCCAKHAVKIRRHNMGKSMEWSLISTLQDNAYI